MKRYISVSNEVRRQLREQTGASEQGIYVALNYERHGELSVRIRELALSLGGRIHLDLPECETIHDSLGRMIQTFDNGAKIVIDKVSGNAIVYFDEAQVAAYNQVSIAHLSRIQAYAQSL